MLELVDRLASGASIRKDVGVRVSLGAQNAWVGGGTWYTRMLEVHVPQGVEVQLLSDPLSCEARQLRTKNRKL